MTLESRGTQNVLATHLVESWTDHLCLGAVIFYTQKNNNKECTRAQGTHDILVWTRHNFILQCKDLWVCQSYLYYVSY